MAAAPISRTLPAVRRPGVPARSSFPSPPRPPSKRPTGVVIGLPPELDRRRFRRRRHVVREEPRVRRRAGTVDRGPLAEHGLQIRAMSVATRISTDSCELVERVTGTISRRRREAYSVVLRREILISIMEGMVHEPAALGPSASGPVSEQSVGEIQKLDQNARWYNIILWRRRL